jgi:polygalacturonase
MNANKLLILGLLLTRGMVLFAQADPRDPFAAVEAILRGIATTRFPERVQTVSNLEGRDSRPAIQAAIDELHGRGGGTVVLEGGLWICDGPVRLKSNVRLHVEAGAHLQFLPNPESYLPPVLTRWEGTEVYSYSPMIHADGQENIAITGEGTIDGQGKQHWLPWRQTQDPIKNILRDMGRDGIPVEDRVFIGERRLRPCLVQFRNCRRVLVDGPTFIDSPFWMIHPLYCEDVIVRNSRFVSRHVNSDGVDPDSSRRVLIENCDFEVGDDGVSLKSGRDQDGWRVGRPTEDVVIRNCRYSGNTGGGVAIGSEMSGGVRNVYVDGFDLPEASHTLFFKANLDRGGVIENIFIRNIRGGRVKTVLVFSNTYHSYRGGNHPPTFRDVLVENVSVEEATIGISIQGHDEAPVERVTVRNFRVTQAAVPLTLSEVREIELKDVWIDGKTISIADAAPVDSKLVGY